MQLTCAVALLLLVVEDRFSADAEPIAGRAKDAGKSDWCNEHKSLHRRIEVVEEQVEKTVEHLYSEVKTLLDTMADPAWQPPVDTGAPVVDIFQEDIS